MDHASGQLVLPSGASAAGEFVAHNAAVTCLSIGPKTGRLLATASEDRKVNLWPVGKSNCLAVSLFPVSLVPDRLPDETTHNTQSCPVDQIAIVCLHTCSSPPPLLLFLLP